MKIPGGLPQDSNRKARKDREIPLMSQTKGTRKTPKVFLRQNESLKVWENKIKLTNLGDMGVFPIESEKEHEMIKLWT